MWIGAEPVFAIREITPTVDLNGNGTADTADIVRLIESWGQRGPVVDAGPTLPGDGVVDTADLKVFMSHWNEPVDDPTLVAHWVLDESEGNIAFDGAGTNDASVIGEPFWQTAGGWVDGAIQLDRTTPPEHSSAA